MTAQLLNISAAGCNSVPQNATAPMRSIKASLSVSFVFMYLIAVIGGGRAWKLHCPRCQDSGGATLRYHASEWRRAARTRRLYYARPAVCELTMASRGEAVKHKLALVLLVLLAVGLTSAALAMQPINCTKCGTSQWTSTWYHCPNCGEWFAIEPAQSETGQLPPAYWTCPNPNCLHRPVAPQYCLCYNPNCTGGKFWSA